MIQLLSGDEYSKLVDGAAELMRDQHGVKVLRTQDSRIVKLFRVKRWYSLSAIYPYSVRFMRNARRLTELGVPTVEVTQVFYCHTVRRHGVVYPEVAGKSLEKIAQDDGLSNEIFKALAEFIADLHDKGIYFRSLHLGNILQLPDGELGLIDIADMRFSGSALRVDQRKRNFRHLLRVSYHREVFEKFGLGRFVDDYISAAGLSPDKANRLRAVAAD